MSEARARGAAVAALVAATAVLAAGCGGSSDGGTDASHRNRPPQASAGPSVTASASHRPDGKSPRKTPAKTEASKPSHAKKDDKKGAGNVSMVPSSELTPATGTFTAKQKGYLVDRVPEGTDPAAVLQAGQEACKRIKSTAELDRKAAVSALKSGEIPNAEPAVAHLCPKLRPLLRDAGLTD